jgi:AGZA family xanthine/uracil permease-like MFS transporter
VGEDCKFDGYNTNPEWAAYISEVKQNLITATCIAACISTIAMALVASMPLAVAPAMGVNAYFA